MRRAGVAMVVAIVWSGSAGAAEPVALTLKDNRFTPAEVRVPAGERFRIEVTNQDATPAEFESQELRIEKVVAAGSKIVVSAGPLKPGRYRFVDEYHPESAAGTLIAVGAGE